MDRSETGEKRATQYLPGTLMKLRPALTWHNAHILDSGDQITGEMHFRNTDRALFIEPYVNRFQPEIQRCKCLVGGEVVMFRTECLEPVE